MSRCHQPGAASYKNYGARGISVCTEWHDSGTFLAYLDEHLGPRPIGHTLDRINNDGNYEPGNVRWLSRVDQAANRRPRRSKLALAQTDLHAWVIA